MFGRRRRAPPNTTFNNNVANTSFNATTAAAQAFLKNQQSNASLAAAAAGAALRSRPTTPISVADVQTKRTIRRSESASSMGSSVAGNGGRRPASQLERRGSSGSMSERTFRDPSPNRGPQGPDLSDAPPVPAIPKNLQSPTPTKSVRRAASVEAPPMRISSPPPNAANGRGSSLGPVSGSTAPRRPAQRNTNLGSVQELTGSERPASRGSVNFSYPRSNGTISPFTQRRLTYPDPISGSNAANQKQNLVYDPNTRTFRPEVELLFYEQEIRNAAERPVKRNRKITAAGSHLAEGSVGGRLKGTAVDAMEAATKAAARSAEAAQPQPQPQSQPVPERQQQQQQQQNTAPNPAPIYKSVPPPEATTPSALAAPKTRKKKRVVMADVDPEASMTSDADSDFSDRAQKYTPRSSTQLAKKPSIVREDREREEEEDDTGKVALGRQAALARLESGANMRTVSPTPLPRSSAGKGHGRGTAAASAAFADTRQQTRSVSQPPLGVATTSSLSAGPEATPDGRLLGASRGARVQSVSPVRTAHFLTTPENQNLSVRHQPPARSISPRKSALKNSSSPRGDSPMGNMPVAYNKAMSDTSDASGASEDKSLSVPKKKAVRVSFDDHGPVVLGTADSPVSTDSPIVASPQTKRGWFSNMGRSKKKEIADEDDEVMKPRPALPSFGSVREKKNRDVEERPLVRPAEPVAPAKEVPLALPSPASPIFTSATGEPIEFPMGQSNDHQIGAVLAQEHLKHEANISKSREPLPPEVTSVEGSGYNSEDSSIYENDEPAKPIFTHGTPDSHADTSRALATPIMINGEHKAPVTTTNGKLPELNLTQPTPTIEDTETRKEFVSMPGRFEDSSDSGIEDSNITIVEHKPTDMTPAEVGIAEPDTMSHNIHGPAVGSIVAENLHREPIFEETESDNDSIYSDAAEDLSDLEGDGFMSLDAVVESPIPASGIPSLSLTTPPESPTIKVAKEKAYKKSQLSHKSSEPDLDEGWEKTQEYWSGLSADKRKELELAARRDAEDSSSEEESEEDIQSTPVVQPTPVPKKKKIIAVLPVEPEPKYRSERTYQIAPGSKHAEDNVPAPTMRSSMRAAPPNTAEETHMRRSMRDGGGGSMRGSMRQPAAPVQPKGSLQKKYRPAMIPQAETRPDPVQVQKHIRSMSNPVSTPSTAKKSAAPLQRTGSDASDSSFKRTRPTSDGYSMRSSMRGSQMGSLRPQSPESGPARSSRFSMRSLSPTGSAFRRPFAPANAPPVSLGRQTMRDRGYSNDSSAPSLRSLGVETKSPMRAFGFGKKSESKTKSKAAPKRASRFADSSDEDDEPRPSFRSRFVDSSDDDEIVVAPVRRPMTTLRAQPVRAIPQRAGTNDGDSSDLPDTDDEKPVARKPGKAATILGNSSVPTKEGASLASGSLRRSGSGRDFIGGNPSATTTSITGGSEHKRRGSIMSILRRKKPVKEFQVRKSEAESPARRDTPLERSRADLAAVKRQDSNFSVSSANNSPRPKLQKRNTGSYTNGNANGSPSMANMPSDWPLGKQDGTSNGDYDRPLTSDGVEADRLANGTPRPDLGSRRVTATGLSAIDLQNSPLKKKKKFGKLRKAFGLDT